MTAYRRARIAGATYFFTVHCAERRGNRLLVDHVDTLRQAFRKVMNDHPFTIDAMVVLPEHLHCIWTLPPDDADYRTRWGLIKANFSRAIPRGERCSASRIKRGERGLWQRRYWEHVIRDERDFANHADYIHWNPVKHGWARRPGDWPWSSFHAYVCRGIYAVNWAWEVDDSVNGGE